MKLPDYMPIEGGELSQLQFLYNLYRVWMETRKGKWIGRATVLCADKPEKGGSNA